MRSLALPGLSTEGAVVPDYVGYSICAIPDLIAFLFGEGRGGPLAEAVGRVVTPPVEKVILLVIDGLGFHHLVELLERFPDLFLRRLIERGAFLPVTSVFPSTTVAALTTYTTGLTPQEHGMVGYRLYLRETSAITNMIRLSVLGNPKGDSAVGAGIDPETFLTGPFLAERLRRLGVETHTLLARQIAGSGLSNLLYSRSDKLHSVTNLSDMLVEARRIVQRARGKVFASLYWAETDAIAHVHGPWTEEFTAELRAVDSALGRELEGKVEGSVMIVSSDHGFVPMEKSDYRSVVDLPELGRDLLLPPVGEPRASYLFVRQGRKEAVAEAVARRLAGDFLCLDSLAALEGGLFGRGKVHPAVADRVGDLVLVSTGRAGLHHSYKDAAMLRGMHGGLTAEEVFVPLVLCSL